MGRRPRDGHADAYQAHRDRAVGAILEYLADPHWRELRWGAIPTRTHIDLGLDEIRRPITIIESLRPTAPTKTG
jgi:hypothetical protein